VDLHCAERGQFPVRPTNDADTVIDVRADLTMLASFTGTLTDLGFTSAGISAEGLQHRWIRGDASIDVLLPDWIGERVSLRQGVTGSPTLPTAGRTQALQRSETVEVIVAGREGAVRRPNLIGALVGKAAALSNAGDPDSGATDETFVILAGLHRSAGWSRRRGCGHAGSLGDRPKLARATRSDVAVALLQLRSQFGLTVDDSRTGSNPRSAPLICSHDVPRRVRGAAGTNLRGIRGRLQQT
jgi:hypothetical protein